MSNYYKDAGVDVEKGYQAVERMKKHLQRTNRPEVLGGIGAFAGLFDLSKFQYHEPVLVSGTDGVGTKLKLAHQLKRHNTVGIDLVAMCVNDIVSQGAQPLFFLDYIACGKNSPEMIEEIVAGISEGCVQAGAALIGGETAEMPGMYADNEYDLAGFSVGIADKANIITGETIQTGDCLIGLSSSGIHSNGYSLVRKLVEQVDLTKVYPGFSEPLQDVLLTPTRIYARAVNSLTNRLPVKGISHITGGGFYENIPRMLPAGLGAAIQSDTWETPEIFSFLQNLGDIPASDMYGIFNMGIGMVIAVSEQDAERAACILQKADEKAAIIGKVTAKEGVHIDQ